MEATTAPDLPPRGGLRSRLGGLPRRASFTVPSAVRNLPPAAIAIAGLVVAVAFVAAITYYGAREFTHDAADVRASEEATSFAKHSAILATGDAFNGYLQILRYADDPVLRAKASTAEQRTATMQQMLYLNTNRLATMAIVDRSGIIFASTDPNLGDVRQSEAFNTTRATLGPANSDIILPAAGRPGYVEFTAPLKDPDGTIWAILYSRADPAALWKGALGATVDGGRNVIINNEGQFSAGVPDELLRSPWHGTPLDNGSVRVTIAGVDSICGLGPIGRDTQIDHGWNVASCLPASLIQLEANRAMGKQGVVTSAAAVLAVVVAALVMYVALPRSRGPAAAASEPEAVAAPDQAIAEQEPIEMEPPDQPVVTAALEPQPVMQIVADVDALRLIEAYEDRNMRVSARLRESIQARLMIAASQADEAYRLAESEPERAAAMHARAMAEFEELRERELRALGQDLHPGLVRLGLPGALNALRKEMAGVLDLDLQIDPDADSPASGGGRPSIDPALRLAIYRAIRETADGLAAAGAETALLSLERDEDALLLTLAAEAPGRFDEDLLAASTLSFAAYGGELSSMVDGSRVVVSATLPAPSVATADEADDGPALPEEFYAPAEDFEEEDEDDSAIHVPANITVISADELEAAAEADADATTDGLDDAPSPITVFSLDEFDEGDGDEDATDALAGEAEDHEPEAAGEVA